MNKQALRTALASRRAEAFAETPDAGLALLTHFPLDFAQVGRLAGYWPFRSEIDPRPLLLEARKYAAICLPRTPQKGVDAGLTFHQCDPWDPDHLERSPWGVMQPRADLPMVRPDTLLVPLLGFDAACNRIGQGQGHYDRTLEALRQTGPVTTIGLAFEAQRLDTIPTEPHDQPLDWILTEKRAYRRV